MEKAENNFDFTVIVPVYNSEKTLEELYQRIQNTFSKLNRTFEIIFVEDCGVDKSWEVLCRIKSKNPNSVTIIKLARNFGQHNAILCGIRYSRGKYVITIDDDLQIPPEEIEKLINEYEKSKSELVYGIYKNRKQNFYRKIGSLLIQLIFKWLFKNKSEITSFRLIEYELASKLSNHKQSFVFLDGLLHWYTKYISYVPVNHLERKYGKSGYNLKKLIKLGSNLIFNFSTIPLRTMIFLGFIFSIITFILGVIFIIRKIIFDVPIGFTSIIVSIFFVGSVILMVIGVVGEYISRIFALQNDKPQFSIKEIK